MLFGFLCVWFFSFHVASPCAAQTGLRATELDVAKLEVKGPLTLQGTVPWQCRPWPAGKGIMGQVTGCFGQFSNISAPKWVNGDGFTVIDGNPSASFPRIYVPNSNVDFEADITFKDDSSVAGVTFVDENSGKRCYRDPDCESGSCSVATRSGAKYCKPATVLVSVFPGVLEGNHARYTVTVQRWDETASACKPPQQSLDPDYPSIRFDLPSPTGASATLGGGSKGCWADLSTSNAELAGSSAGPSSPTIASQNESVAKKIEIPINLTGVATYLRYVVTVSEGDTRVPASTEITGWAPGRASPNLAACDPHTAAPNVGAVCPISSSAFRTYFPLYPGSGRMYDWVIQHPISPSFFSYTAALNPFQIVVLPVALAQLKVMPYTLIYQPPGDASKATFATTTSFGISMSVDTKLSSSQVTAVDDKGSEISGFGLAMSGNKGGEKSEHDSSDIGFTDLLGKSGDFSLSFSQATSWDKSTKLGVGTIKDVATDQSTNYQSTMSLQLSNTSLTPGPTGSYANAPFWSDTFVLLVHPQVGFWQLGGIPVVSMLAATGTPASPEFFEPTVGDLDACVNGIGSFAQGIRIPGTSDVLNKEDCRQLLQLDPFYMVGQNPAGLPNNPRFTRVSGTDYGVDPVTRLDLSPSLNQIVSFTGSTVVTSMNTYNASITDVLGSSGSLGGGLKIFGVNGSDKLEGGETVTKSTEWAVTLQTSYTATAQSSTSITGILDDHHGLNGDGNFLPNRPHVEIYRDNLFGSFVFVDPSATGAPP
jgi:hypothetical protein